MPQHNITDLEIKLLQPEDYTMWKEIRLESLLLDPQAYGDSYDEMALYSYEDFSQYLKDGVIFGAIIQNRLVGCAAFYVENRAKIAHKGWLRAVYVTPCNRGKSIGYKLVTSVIDHARDMISQIHCGVTIDGFHAINLYMKLGFIIYGTEPRCLRVDNKFYDVYFMALQLH